MALACSGESEPGNPPARQQPAELAQLPDVIDTVAAEGAGRGIVLRVAAALEAQGERTLAAVVPASTASAVAQASDSRRDRQIRRVAMLTHRGQPTHGRSRCPRPPREPPIVALG
jgi:hypothetical protein